MVLQALAKAVVTARMARDERVKAGAGLACLSEGREVLRGDVGAALIEVLPLREAPEVTHGAVGPCPRVQLGVEAFQAGLGADADDVDHILMAVRRILVVGNARTALLGLLGSTGLLFVHSGRRRRGR